MFKKFHQETYLDLSDNFFFILNLPKKSIAIELLNFSSFISKDVSSAAVIKARAKLSPEAFIGLNQVLVREFYSNNKTKTFLGYTLIAIDGLLLEMPLNSPEIKEKYGAASNQTDYKKPMARSSSAFDVLNGITLDAILASYHSGERDLAMQNIKNIVELKLEQLFLFIFDRGYPSLELLIFLFMMKVNFIMRSNTKFLKEINDLIVLRKKDTIIKINTSKLGNDVLEKLRFFFPNLVKKTYFSLRIILIKLSTGETEILLTSLLDKETYPYKIFKELYFKRWGIEEEYDFKKNSIEIENFSGKSCIAVEQDFHATILAGNIYALLSHETQNELESDKGFISTKYQYKVNRNVGIAMLKNSFIEVLTDHRKCLRSYCNRIKLQMKRNLVPIRPGRSYPRRKKHLTHKYHMSQR